MRWRPPASGRWGWGSPISARRWCCGTAAPSVRSRRPSSGRTGAPATAAASSGRPASRPCSAGAPGWLADPYFSATKLEWLLRDPELRRRAGRGELAAGTVESWLVARLTGGRVHASDHTNASRTLLYDLASRDWHPELLDIFGVPREVLPGITSSSGFVGDTDPAHLGFALPIAGLAGDQQSALFGQGCCTEGLAKNTYGTGAFLLVYRGTSVPEPPRGVLATAACGPRGEPAFALEGSVFIAGAAVQWLRDGLRIIESAPESDRLARSVESTEGVAFVPAFVGLGTPHWEAEARGTIVGLTRGSSRAHLVRAALEAIAFSCADLLHAMTGTGELQVPALRVDGGGAANDWMMQFQADVLGLPVERPDMVETTALGAAALAGLALDVWKQPGEFLAGRRFTRFTPAMDRGSGEDACGSGSGRFGRRSPGRAKVGNGFPHTASDFSCGRRSVTREAAAASSTSRTFRSSASGPNGLGRNVAPGSSRPPRTTVVSVYPDM